MSRRPVRWSATPARVPRGPEHAQWVGSQPHKLSDHAMLRAQPQISEWADDPFVNNTVQPWLTPTAPQYGRTNIPETGDR